MYWLEARVMRMMRRVFMAGWIGFWGHCPPRQAQMIFPAENGFFRFVAFVPSFHASHQPCTDTTNCSLVFGGGHQSPTADDPHFHLACWPCLLKVVDSPWLTSMIYLTDFSHYVLPPMSAKGGWKRLFYRSTFPRAFIRKIMERLS